MPEFASLFERLQKSTAEAVQEEIKLTRAGKQESLLVRMATRRNADGAAGRLRGGLRRRHPPQLVSAQRMAAWGAMSRAASAHEIKNPLTPIQLSAERINRRYSKELEGEEEGKARKS